MRAFLVSDNHDTVVGLRLAGIPGVIVHGPEETTEAVLDALKVPELGLLVVTEKAAAAAPEIVGHLRERGELPLVVVIPDRHGTSRDSDYLTRYVRDAIGVKLG
jgi:V/A-type H+-transporting ATPase subunit F